MTRKLITGLFVLSTIHLFAQSYVPELDNPKMRVRPKANIKAYAFNLKEVKLLEGSPFWNAMEKESAYLLILEPDRLLHRFHANAGLPTKGEVYGGWESEGLSGHSLGHYLSDCALYYANTGNVEFKKRVDYIVDELERCQVARKTGYVGAIPNEDTIFAQVARGDIRSSGFDLNGGWSPWYTVHKVMAGLVDAYMYCDNAKALRVVEGMSVWAEGVMKNLTEEQRLKMLNCEYGGMQDVLSNIYELTGNERYLKLSYKFDDEFVMGQLAKRIDPMPGKHSNTNIPKVVGAARRYELTGAESDRTIASFFWETMVHHHTYVIGGNSNYEYCGEPDKLNDRLSDNTCETCNTYNMLKLTRHLFAWNPSRELGDYFERAHFNHILSSQNPINGMNTYFHPLRMGTIKEFSDQFNTFTCCVGTSMENHSKHVEGVYSETREGNLFVNLYIATELNWKRFDTKILLETTMPFSEKVIFTVKSKKTREFAVYFREPRWVNMGMKVMVNGKSVPAVANSFGYIEVKRKWGSNDRVELTLPMSLHTEAMPDNPNRIAFLYGPLVLAAQLGKDKPDPVLGTPVLLTDNRNVNDWVKPVPGKPLTFKMQGVGKPFDATLVPVYTIYDQFYSVYFDYFTPSDWTARQQEYEADKKRQQEIEEKTIDNIRIGEMQPERDHSLEAGERSYVGIALDRMGREARSGSYFAFDMKVLPDQPNTLLFTYIGDDKGRKWDVLVDDVKIATVEWDGGVTGKFFDFEYPIPDELVKGKTKIRVRIDAVHGKIAGRIFGCRTIKGSK